MKTNQTNKAGFTLVELLLVIGIIATLAVVVFVALDPAKRFADARDARRTSDVETILSAVHQYIIDNKGSFPSGIQSAELQIGKASGTECTLYTNYCDVGDNTCLDLSGSLAKYIKELPIDPQSGNEFATHYSIQLDANSIVTVKACDAEGGVISVSR